ncbi:hypothetical protein HO924_04165 [Streptococcus suis]|nr:hypothetical protein [Streptococcus suis]NQP33744.1 hypothetical protein [Streptococcus suis]NQP36129.1 hypothetical protein [Streptococcus suis]
MTASFKQKIREELIVAADLYNKNFLEVDYLIYSKSFQHRTHYFVSAKDDNFLHLTGVKTSESPKVFFAKCLSGTLLEEDFDLGNKSQKGSIRRKMSVLKKALTIFTGHEIVVEEQFQKNRISCSFASTDNVCTIGFTKTLLAKPQTVLKGNILKQAVNVDLIFKKSRDEESKYKVVYKRGDISEQEAQQLLYDLIQQ